MAKKRNPSEDMPAKTSEAAYEAVLAGVIQLLESARRAVVRSINAAMTATYCEVGRRIVEEEQRGRKRAAYGERLIERLSSDLTKRFGRGFSPANLKQMRKFYLEWGTPQIRQTPSDQFADDLPQAVRTPAISQAGFPLSWSHYIRLMSVGKPEARSFYEAEALRGGWSSRQLNRQISTQFYERTMLSRNKAAMLAKAQQARREKARGNPSRSRRVANRSGCCPSVRR